MQQKVVNYDGYDYDYSTYWKDRQYEDIAEHIVLEKLLKNEGGKWFIDIGGSYGRLADSYSSKYDHCVILDYSLKTLQKNYKQITKLFPNAILVSANAYKMPFKDNSFDGGLMVRVLHHIEKQEEYLNELSRVLNSNSVYLQEFANKRHIKARVKAILHKDKNINTLEPYQQPTINLEGAKGTGVSFLNYHTKFITSLLKKTGFNIEKKQGCSYLRIPFLKRFLGTKLLIFFEKISQSLFAKTDLSPSIFLKARLTKDVENPSNDTIEDILVCPKCKNSLKFNQEKAVCTKCNFEYFIKEDVWDLRVD